MTEHRAVITANEAAAEMRRKLEGGLTPAAMGWPHLTADELVASEWRCWFKQELAELTRQSPGANNDEQLQP